MQRNEPIDAETLLSTPLPPVRWLIPGLLPAGLSLLAGASKAGKSWLCLWLCLQLARGGEIWGRTTVLYLCLEDTHARIQGRLFRLTEDPVPSRLYFQTGSCAIGDGLELQIEKFLSQHPETGLVVIDTLQKVRTADPNNGAYASDYQDMSALKSLADRRDIGLLLVHHLRKQGASDPFQQISGSNGLMGAADTIWLLQRQRMSDTARLLVTGRDMDSCTLHLQTRDCIWQLLEEETAEEQVRKAIPDYLWRTADFVRRAGSWTGTATALLTAAGITDVQPNQFTRKLVEHFYTVFAPQGIRYQSRRTSNTRLLCFICDGDDGHDGSDDDTARSPLPSGTVQAGEEGAAPVPSSSSSPSPGPHHGSKHAKAPGQRRADPAEALGVQRQPPHRGVDQRLQVSLLSFPFCLFSLCPCGPSRARPCRPRPAHPPPRVPAEVFPPARCPPYGPARSPRGCAGRWSPP